MIWLKRSLVADKGKQPSFEERQKAYLKIINDAGKKLSVGIAVELQYTKSSVTPVMVIFNRVPKKKSDKK